MRFASTIAVLVAAGLLSGCATSPQAAPTAPASAGFATLAELPATGSVEATDLRPGPQPGPKPAPEPASAQAAETWVAVSGLLSPETFEIVTETDEADLMRTRTADLETAHWSVQADGSLVLHAVDSHPDETTSRFDPPLLLAPAQLPAGESVTAKTAMRAVFTATPKRERDRGTATRTVRYARDEEISWRGSTHRAKVVEVRFTGALGSATAERTAELWVIPGEGIVAERWKETLTILKVFPKRSEQFSYRR